MIIPDGFGKYLMYCDKQEETRNTQCLEVFNRENRNDIVDNILFWSRVDGWITDNGKHICPSCDKYSQENP